MLHEELSKRILILDGAMGTVLQKYSLQSEDFCGAVGCYEILNETRAEIILEVHKKYIEAGADIIETNSFNCNAISLKDYQLENKVYSLAKKSAEIARQAVEESGKKIYVLGSVGPTKKSLSFSLGDAPYQESLLFQELRETYYEQILGLVDGGVDGILIETVFDALNAKAAVIAAEEVFAFRKKALWICISATVNEQGKLLTGESIEALILFLDRPSILSFGFNCSFGAKYLVPLIQKIQSCTTKYISLYPNAGLPNQNGDYMETAEQMIQDLLPVIQNQKVNMLGGCCGTSYEYIRALAKIVSEKK
ncbi:5-methyltetrahydrofolate--homocysteine methyltransferase [Fusobacterium necrophorum subsp. funduliforme]|uniref:Methionine synthase n=2 Tax=Fusobacterium necrophorum TaxID=859 RepID=A0AAN4ATH9_9FUSO|nr:homocysteine S-methyltransferase family protein [Fusobacterium necrophorum]AYV94549.1 5-methyltetrahydrofolate--homocysteine methyltransferase [Fusobacterium necrophorum subsp. funduliforme]EFS22530.1 homocysteine S-methyltransferase [Fusobacterium necrophorum D12]EJU18425.1 homocysteine S-methyltransferase [Fusobacterium necrophorum subsp. funduliforme Fnf 1007]KYL02652.1 5-methyltetrahydrofolate--homocysteine methyltransferase [Fusobacterium necrophorum subsp. funduliforme]KYL04101.1 5-me